MTQKALGEWGRIEFNLSTPIHQPTLSRYLIQGKKGVYNDMNSTELTAKRVNEVVNKELDETLAAWVLKCQQAGAALTGHLIMQKGEALAETMQPAPSFSHGWLYKFLVRHKLQGVKMHGESGSVDQEAVQAAITNIQQVIAEFDPNDVYNMDETGLYYCLAPNRTIASGKVSGFKKVKTRMSIALASNATGTDKRPLLFIGTSRKPKCCGRKTPRELGFQYYYNKNAWMTGNPQRAMTDRVCLIFTITKRILCRCYFSIVAGGVR